MKYALVHEWLTPQATGGSELVVKEILRWVDADLYALIDFESGNAHSYLYGRTIGTTFLQKFPYAQEKVQRYLPLFPIAIEQLNLAGYDVILSSSHAVAKGVITRPEQLHICYCHTPMRYAWDLTFDYLAGSKLGKGIPGTFTRGLLHYLRQWDVISANRVDYFIANSQYTAQRIWRCYRRRAKVIYPPVEIDRFPYVEKKEDFYVTVSRLVGYKKVSLIVEAFNELGLPLIVIGDGEEMEKIRSLAKGNVHILGAVDNQTVAQYMAAAKAFVYAAREDFGIAPVEAQACGTPVIAFGAGGALETVKDWREHPDDGTGLLFRGQTVKDLVEAVKTFAEEGSSVKPENCRLQAIKFTPKIFKESYLGFLEDCDQGRPR
ncbi:MAG: D-inositol-3-phosphate glycosyltransferase [Chroococcopsis gigantea SAG 12.99]|jgi:glycosyltransferase involved in cell wall biosynthesis|nr:glycosyltransferase [Chlorogloea purpurea SAG 13.99]MDV3001628.1 D-inositol-3-phosphate glycosyltransferase [Chroococcopsis gigantea SAG 12.99]